MNYGKETKMILFDTYAWIEYFKGTEKGKVAEKFMFEEDIITPSIVLIELSCKSAKEKWDFESYLNFIKSKSKIIGLNEKTIIKCGKIYTKEKEKKPNFGIADGIILTTALEINCKILTGDKHFSDLKETIML
jgi:predicted nucleic acid-binding protein